MQHTSKDGYIIDTETGEVLGIAETPERFEVDSREKAEWVLSKMMDCDSEIVALEARLKAVTANLQAQIKEMQRRLDYLRFRFEADLKAFAEKQLEGSSSRTLKLDHGQLSFRKSPGSIKVLDQDEAVKWLEKSRFYEAIKTTRSVLVSQIPKGKTLPAELFEQTPEMDKFSVKTGVKGE